MLIPAGRWELSSSSDRRALDIVDGAGLHAGKGAHYSRRTPGSKRYGELPAERGRGRLSPSRLALAPLAAIAEAYEAERLDAVDAYGQWFDASSSSGDGKFVTADRGRTPLLTLAHCLAARRALAETSPDPKTSPIDPDGACPQGIVHVWRESTCKLCGASQK